jgi:hypothetical protein
MLIVLIKYIHVLVLSHGLLNDKKWIILLFILFDGLICTFCTGMFKVYQITVVFKLI